MIFTDRRQAAEMLAKKLQDGHVTADIVVGLTHGGVVISSVLSKKLSLPQGALIVKKIGSPGNPELAIGAVVPSGQHVDVEGKNVIVADDGIATGETMRAAALWLKQHGAAGVTVAVPVAPPLVIDELKRIADRVISVYTTADFGAIGEFYKDFPQLTDADVIKLLT